MVNVRTINDLPPQQAENNQLSGMSPKDVWPPLSRLLLSKFKFLSFTFITACILIIMFLVTIIVADVMFGSIFIVTDRDKITINNNALVLLGGKVTSKIQSGEVWRFITPAFLHGHISHLVFNTLFLFFIGFIVENDWGVYRTLAFFFVGTLCSTALSCVASPETLSVGASGFIAAFFGVEIAFLVINWRSIENRVSRAFFVGIIIVINIVFGISNSTIDHWGHLGGLLGGLLLAFVISPPYFNFKRAEVYMRTFFGFLVLGLGVGLTVGTFYVKA